MTATASLFLFATILLAAMFYYRVWEIRTGRFNSKEISKKELGFSVEHIEGWNSKFIEVVRHSAHLLMVLIVRTTIATILVVRKELQRLSMKLDRFFLNNGGPKESKETTSLFLKDIAEYKAKLKGVAQNKKVE